MKLPAKTYFQRQPEASETYQGGGARIVGNIRVRRAVFIVGTAVQISRMVRPGSYDLVYGLTWYWHKKYLG